MPALLLERQRIGTQLLAIHVVQLRFGVACADTETGESAHYGEHDIAEVAFALAQPPGLDDDFVPLGRERPGPGDRCHGITLFDDQHSFLYGDLASLACTLHAGDMNSVDDAPATQRLAIEEVLPLGPPLVVVGRRLGLGRGPGCGRGLGGRNGDGCGGLGGHSRATFARASAARGRLCHTASRADHDGDGREGGCDTGEGGQDRRAAATAAGGAAALGQAFAG